MTNPHSMDGFSVVPGPVKGQSKPLLDRLLTYIRSGGPDMTNRQIALLLLIEKNGPMRCRELAHDMQVSRPVITRASRAVASLGYAERQRDERDRRDLYIVITPAGRAFLKRLPW